MLHTLKRIAECLRIHRLGPSGMLRATGADAVDSPDAHMLVEELMITANTAVAGKLHFHHETQQLAALLVFGNVLTCQSV